MVKRLLYSLILAITLLSIVSALTITSPANTTYGINVTSLTPNYGADPIDTCVYSLDDGANNLSNFMGVPSKEGSNIINLYCKNSTTNTPFLKQVTYWQDSLDPDITITNPINNPSYQNSSTITISALVSDTNLVSGILSLFYVTGNALVQGNHNLLFLSTYTTSSGLPEGEYYYNITAEDTISHSVQKNGTIFLDRSSPTYSNLQTPLSNVYSPGKDYDFSIVWSDLWSPIDSIWVNFSGQIYNDDNITISNLGAGDYNYTWYANDSLGNTNTTGILTYTVAKNTTECSLIGNNVEYPNPVNVTASCNQEQGSLNLYRDGADVTSNNSKNILLPIGSYLFLVNMSETANYTSASTTLQVNVTDTTSPSISPIIFSNNNAFNLGDSVFIEFNVTDNYNVSNCSLILNSILNETISSISQGVSYNFTSTSLSPGINNYSVICYDNYNNFDQTSTSVITILSTLSESSEFTNYTNLSAELDIRIVSYFFVANTHGIINWTGPLDLSDGADWSQAINISEGRIDINITLMPVLNSSAIITMYNINYSNPQIMKDGIICTDCTIISYTNYTLIFNTTSMGLFSVRETPAVVYLGGGGGGGSSDASVCKVSSWDCGEWSICDEISFTQTRTCTSNCDGSLDETQLCVPESAESSESDQEAEGSAGITGAAIGARTVQIGGAILFIGLIIGAYVFVNSKKKNIIKEKTQDIISNHSFNPKKD